MDDAPFTSTILTLQDYEALPHDERYLDEVSRGVLVREPRPGYEHGDVVITLAAALHTHVERHRLGRVLSETGFVLREQPFTLRGPDVAFLRAERVPSARLPGFFHGAPDLIVEVVSPSNRPGDLLQKVGEFLEAGTEVAWVVYPATQIIVEHTAAGDVRVLGAQDVLAAPAVLPGFALRVADIFRD